ncbi:MULTISPECIES: hypothetical protein [Achromobacter]|uniref:Uncharacterized protein n=1 Tax=Achromobacter mucicolens TaxID=1389922 RepID=A0ABM8LL04_9BURK|nr:MULTISPECIES: hypothetical protein [Achromobacter]AVG43912.1 hypothetical protein MC81_30875 [Achromobacter insolitus]CAB3845663.1 hypothetical protein LMG3410_01501 [Achromobacter aegrifaciens]CAB3914348.1 hypothetical protein LMG3415_05148 [Achromobacter mucicolens]
MRIPVTAYDLSSGLFTRSARLLGKRWPAKLRGLAHQQNILAAAMGYRDYHDLQTAAHAGRQTLELLTVEERQRALAANLTRDQLLEEAAAMDLALALPLAKFGSKDPSSRESAQSPFLVVLDEMGYYMANHDDGLIAELRVIDGIPNATYLVKDGRVFVFKKLVQLVKEHRARETTVALEDLARGLVNEAIVPAKEAVESWGVVPNPYEMVVSPAGALMIRHAAFNARLPGDFHVEGEVRDAFAGLLLGIVQSGLGEFVYRGQPMSLCEPLDLALLPPRPTFQCMEEPAGWDFTALGGVTYVAGFEPVSEALFNDVKEREATWSDERARARRYVQAHVATIWAQAATLRLAALDEPTNEVPDYGREEFAALRRLYPELTMLSDGTLYAWFDSYQVECCYINGWTPDRDDDFLYYLLGKVAGRNLGPEEAKEVGQWTAYALLHCELLDEAFAFGRAVFMYNRSLSNLANRIARALGFVAEDQEFAGLRGKPLVTMQDMFRLSRKFNVKSTPVEQNLSNLLGAAGAEIGAKPRP